MEWDPKNYCFMCPSCGNTMKLDENKESVQENKLDLSAKNKIKVGEKKSQTMECKGCGAMVEVEANDTALQCPYCGSSYVLAQKQVDVIEPDGVIPFKIEQMELRKRFNDWIKGKWLAPGSLKNLYQGGKIKGIYVPYWTFDADCRATYSAQGGTHREEKYKDSEGKEQTRTVTDWTFTTGVVKGKFDDVTVPATKSLKGGLLSSAEPFKFDELVGYKPQYLSGFMSENFSIDLDEGHKDARNKMDNEMESKASSDVLKRFDEVKDVSIAPTYSNETFKYILVPVYATTYSFKGKVYNVVINGQTGKISGEYPKSAAKIIIIIAVIIAIIVLIVALSGKSKAAEITTAHEPYAITADATDDDYIYAESISDILDGSDYTCTVIDMED